MMVTMKTTILFIFILGEQTGRKINNNNNKINNNNLLLIYLFNSTAKDQLQSQQEYETTQTWRTKIYKQDTNKSEDK
jgi:hypothetical protein